MLFQMIKGQDLDKGFLHQSIPSKDSVCKGTCHLFSLPSSQNRFSLHQIDNCLLQFIQSSALSPSHHLFPIFIEVTRSASLSEDSCLFRRLPLSHIQRKTPQYVPINQMIKQYKRGMASCYITEPFFLLQSPVIHLIPLQALHSY